MTRSLVELVGLSPRCQQFVDYWFSNWEGDKLPTPAMFSLDAVPQLKPYILTMVRRPDGNSLVTFLGKEMIRAGAGGLVGTAWSSHAPLDHRAELKRRNDAVVRGALLRANRQVQLPDGSMHHFETIAVPLRHKGDEATIALLVNWPAQSKVRLTPADLVRVSQLAEFIPIVEDIPDKAETQLVGKALQQDERVKVISRAAIRYVLNFMGDTMAGTSEAGLDATDCLIALAIGSANVSHIDNDAALSREYAGLIEPDWMRRGISRAAIARATMLPAETVRRRVNDLIRKKILIQREDGILLSATNPLKLGARLDRMHAHAHLTDRLIRDLKARGVTFS